MTLHKTYADGAIAVEGGTVARITLNVPTRRNAVSQAMWQALPGICRDLAGARVVVLSGAGGHFSAGADISEFDRVYADDATIAASNAAVRAGQQAVADIGCPVIAMVDGVCVGGGCGLALHADLRFASERARFAITPAKLGLAYSFEDTRRLIETVGPAAAKDLLFSGRMVAAAEALRLGLVDQVVPPDRLEAEVTAYAAGIAAQSSASHRVTKRMVAAVQRGAPSPEDLAAFDGLFSGADFREGAAAFREKRPPDYGDPLT
ncbi:MAG: enoyl-CoA hydratase-related protein [Pseudomonadota bacterium]